MYALLSGKKEVTYNTFFLQLKPLKIGFNPSHISVDFEQATINAFRANFSVTTIDGCFFLTFLRIFIKRYSQKDCNTNIRIADETFSNNVKMLAALAFVPLNDVINAFDAVVAQMPEQLDPITDYFKITI